MKEMRTEYFITEEEKNAVPVNKLQDKLIEKAIELRDKILKECGGDNLKMTIVTHVDWEAGYSQVFYDSKFIGHLKDEWNKGVFTFTPNTDRTNTY